MSFIDVNEIRIYEDQVQDHDILKNIITSCDQEDAFYILDLGIVIKKHQDWIQKMPRVVPYFGKVSKIMFYYLTSEEYFIVEY